MRSMDEETDELMRTGLVREIRHLNHFLMEPILCKLYRVITGRIEHNQVEGIITGCVISYYRFLKKSYVRNYFRAHPWEQKRQSEK